MPSRSQSFDVGWGAYRSKLLLLAPAEVWAFKRMAFHQWLASTLTCNPSAVKLGRRPFHTRKFLRCSMVTLAQRVRRSL
jgi:hypothetical protein